MKIVILGLSISSSWGNGHATTYRSLCRALHLRGHTIYFIEKDVEWYASHRDLTEPEYCRLAFYTDWNLDGSALACRLAADADVVLIGSYFPDAIEATRVLRERLTIPLAFYDIDTPITLAALRSTGKTSYLEADLVPAYAAYISFTGGPALIELESSFGSPLAVPLYCSVDPAVYQKTLTRAAYSCDLSYLGTYAADRQAKLLRLLVEPAVRLPSSTFLVAGPMYPPDVCWPANTRAISHVAPAEHPAFYSSTRFSLNLTRKEMVRMGFSPSIRLFEAAACGSAILSDTWPGIDTFLTPGEEILIVTDADAVIDALCDLPDTDRLRIGRRARDRILSGHTAAHRALEFESIVERMTTSKLLKQLQVDSLNKSSRV